jgi:hypothetical protein
MRPALRLVLLLALLTSPSNTAERLVGRARIIDGDTIVVGGVHVRLQGVAAPEVAHPGQAQDELGGPEARAFSSGSRAAPSCASGLTNGPAVGGSAPAWSMGATSAGS